MTIMEQIQKRIDDRKRDNWPLKELRMTRRDYDDLLLCLDEAGLLTGKTKKSRQPSTFMGIPIKIIEVA